jgi:hypothetical protein
LTQARGFFERALVIDPRSIRALVGVASVELNMGGSLLADDRAARCSAAETHAIKALSLVPDHAGAHLVLGSAYILTNRAARGITECEQTLALDRNSADAHGIIGLASFCRETPTFLFRRVNSSIKLGETGGSSRRSARILRRFSSRFHEASGRRRSGCTEVQRISFRDKRWI